MGVKPSSYSKYSQPKLFDNLRTCLTKIPNQLENPNCNVLMRKELPSKTKLLEELTELEAKLILTPASPGGKNFSSNPSNSKIKIFIFPIKKKKIKLNFS